MKAIRWDRLRSALVPALVGACLAAGAVAMSFLLVFSGSPGTSDGDAAGPSEITTEVPVDVTRDPTPSVCTASQMIEPGEYENIERSGGVHATWVIIPDSYEEIAPAPLYVLSVDGFTGATADLDLLRPTFGALDGVVLLTAVASTDDELSALIAEVTGDFCVDVQRVVTSRLPLLSSPMPPRPEHSEKPTVT